MESTYSPDNPTYRDRLTSSQQTAPLDRSCPKAKQIDPNDDTPWHKREKTIHGLGIALLAIGVAAAAATVAVALFLTATPVIIITAVSIGAIASTAMIIAGICLTAKSQFWEDPAYRERQKESIAKEVKGAKLSYQEMANKYQVEIGNYKLFSDEDYDAIFGSEIGTCDYPTFKNKHGDELIAKLSEANRQKLLDSYLQHLGGISWSFKDIQASPEWKFLFKGNSHPLDSLLQQDAHSYSYSGFCAHHGPAVLRHISISTRDILRPKYFLELSQKEWSFSTIKKSCEWEVFIKDHLDELSKVLNNDVHILSYAQFSARHGPEALQILPANNINILIEKYFDELSQETWSYTQVRKSAEWPLFVRHNLDRLESFILSNAQSMSYAAFIERHGSSILDDLTNSKIIEELTPKYLSHLSETDHWNYKNTTTSRAWQLFQPTAEQLGGLCCAKAHKLSFTAYHQQNFLDYLKSTDLQENQGAEIKKIMRPKFTDHIASLSEGVKEIEHTYSDAMTLLGVPPSEIALISILKQIEELRSGGVTYQQFRTKNSLAGVRLFLQSDTHLLEDFRQAFLRMHLADMTQQQFNEDRELLAIQHEDIVTAVKADAVKMGYFAFKGKHGWSLLEQGEINIYDCPASWGQELYRFLEQQPASTVLAHAKELKLFNQSPMMLLVCRWGQMQVSAILESRDKAEYIAYYLSTPEGKTEETARFLTEVAQNDWKVQQLLIYKELWQLKMLSAETQFADGCSMAQKLDREISNINSLTELMEFYAEAYAFGILSKDLPHVRRLVIELHKHHSLQALPSKEAALLKRYPDLIPTKLPKAVGEGMQQLQAISAQSQAAEERARSLNREIKQQLQLQFTQDERASNEQLIECRTAYQQQKDHCDILKRQLNESQSRSNGLLAELQSVKAAPAKAERLLHHLTELQARDQQLRLRVDSSLRQCREESLALDRTLKRLTPPIVTGFAEAIRAERELSNQRGGIQQKLAFSQRQQQQLEQSLRESQAAISRCLAEQQSAAQQANMALLNPSTLERQIAQELQVQQNTRQLLAQAKDRLSSHHQQLSRQIALINKNLALSRVTYEQSVAQADRKLATELKAIAEEKAASEQQTHEAFDNRLVAMG
jgi:hypothetical protein